MTLRIAGRRLARICVCLALLAVPAAVLAQVTLPTNASLRVDGGRIDFGGTSLTVGGALRLGAGRLDNLDDFRIVAGGSADLGSGVLRLAGDWENRGTVAAGSSTVEFVDGFADSEIIGTTTFASLRIATAMGNRVRFESGQTQHVAANLVLTGSGAPLRIESTAPPSVAYLDLQPGATQTIGNVAVSDVYGTGQLLAPGQTNQGGNGNAQGWFGTVAVAPQLEVIPSTSPWSLLLLAALVTLVLAFRGDLRARLSAGEIA
jgi:hypothetical protein